MSYRTLHFYWELASAGGSRKILRILDPSMIPRRRRPDLAQGLRFKIDPKAARSRSSLGISRYGDSVPQLGNPPLLASNRLEPSSQWLGLPTQGCGRRLPVDPQACDEIKLNRAYS